MMSWTVKVIWLSLTSLERTRLDITTEYKYVHVYMYMYFAINFRLILVHVHCTRLFFLLLLPLHSPSLHFVHVRVYFRLSTPYYTRICTCTSTVTKFYLYMYMYLLFLFDHCNVQIHFQFKGYTYIFSFLRFSFLSLIFCNFCSTFIINLYCFSPTCTLSL